MFRGKFPELLHGPCGLSCQVGPLLLSKVHRLSISDMLFIFNPRAQQLLVLLRAVSGSSFTGDPRSCLAFSLQLLLALALELELADGGSFPSVQH